MPGLGTLPKGIPYWLFERNTNVNLWKDEYVGNPQ